MNFKINYICEKQEVHASLRNGYYVGIWTGNIIQIKYGNKNYELTTDIDYNGVNKRVVVHVQDQILTFDELAN